MSAFSDGLVAGLASPVGLASSISKLMMLGPQIEQMRQKGVLNGAQAALYQAKRDNELQNLALVKAVSDKMRSTYGDEYALVQPKSVADAQKMLAFAQGFNQMNQVNRAFPIQDSRAVVQRAVDAAGAAPSVSEDAQVTPPISAFRGFKGVNVRGSDGEPAVDNRQLLENLQKNIDWTSKVNGAMQGRAMHRAVGNTGYSIDPYLGDSDVSNKDLVRMYTDKANLDIANKQSIITNRGQIMARRAATPIRGSGGGHHKRRGGGRGGVKTQVVTVDGRKLLIDKQTGETIKDLGSADSRGRGGRRGVGAPQMSLQQAQDFLRATGLDDED